MRFLLVGVLLVATSVEDFWLVQISGIDTNLRAVSSVVAAADTGGGDVVVWASGSNGVVLRSVDGGRNWERLAVSGGEKLDFRGIWAFDAKTAYVMSVGDGDQSRIYKTIDSGRSWSKQYVGQRHEIFLDGLVCRSAKECFVVGDPVDTRFLFLRTVDGEHWVEYEREDLPSKTEGGAPSGNTLSKTQSGPPTALKNEGVFAASNSSLVLCGERDLFFGTGGPAARVFRSADSGRSWSVMDTPILSGNASSGIFSLACWRDTLVAVGGDYQKPNASERVAAYSSDEGKTWRLAEQQPSGFRSAVLRRKDGALVAAGMNGTDVSLDGGAHWTRKSSSNLNAIFVLPGRDVWAVGANGTVARAKD